MNLRAPSAAALSAIKAIVFFLCLAPAALIAQGWIDDTLGANPIEAITHASGEWTLRFLLVTLAVTPLRRLTGLHWLLRLRRTLGLAAFGYGLAHLVTYVWFDQFFDWAGIAHDIAKRPYITVGFAALVLMVPLAATSNKAMIRRLGGRRWQALHRATYAIAILGVVHYWWLVKADILPPATYGAILAVLLGARLWWREIERRRQAAAARPAARVIPIVAARGPARP